MANLNNHSKDNRHGGAKCSPPKGWRSQSAFGFEKGRLAGSQADRDTPVGVFLLFLIVLIALASCNVTRTITTSAQTIQRGDTTTIIQTKTIEQYDGAVDATKLLKK